MSPLFRETQADHLVVRPLRDDDALDVIELIAGVFGEYVGCVTDVDGEMPELRRLATYYAEHAGAGWVAVRGARVIGTVGLVVGASTAPGAAAHRGTPGEAPAVAELKKLYVHRTERGSGIAGTLIELAVERARASGAGSIELWSDTRFERAHRFYEKRGFSRGPHTRDLHDLSKTTEYFYDRVLG